MTAQDPGAARPPDRPSATGPEPSTEPAMTNHAIRFFGGPPLAVVVRLILLSILVGVVLHASGLDPWNILDSIRRFVLSIWNMGFDAVRSGSSSAWCARRASAGESSHQRGNVLPPPPWRAGGFGCGWQLAPVTSPLVGEVGSRALRASREGG